MLLSGNTGIITTMKLCSPVTFTTPDQYQLKGLWFNSGQSKTGFIVVHGLGSSVFSQHDSILPLVDKETSAIFFNNRGHDTIGGVRKLTDNNDKGYETMDIGAAHEVFSDCVYDIQGAVNFLKDHDIQEIYLVGHSTGCQKSIYYLSQNQADIKGVVLLAPVSDYAFALANQKQADLMEAVEAASKLINEGRPHDLMPGNYSSSTIDAQRFLSLHDANSIEEIFSYSQPNKEPKILLKVNVPTLALIGENDQYADRPVGEIIDWFKNHTNAPLSARVIKGSMHNFLGYGDEVAGNIKSWMLSLPKI